MFYWPRYLGVLRSLVKIMRGYHLDRKDAITRNPIVFNGEVFQYFSTDKMMID